MAFTDQFFRAVADYAVKFPNLDSLGDGDPPVAWLAEYNRARATAFAAVLITGSGSEGANASGQRQFPQELLLDALHCRRFDLDEDYELPPHLAQYPDAKAARSSGGRRHVIRFSP